MFKFIYRSFLILALSASISACGFHLRGKIVVPESLQTMHIKGDEIELIQQLGDALAFSDIQIVELADNVAILDMDGTTYIKDVNGTNDIGIATSYKLEYKVKYQVFDADANLMQQHNLYQRRSIDYDVDEILIFERQEKFLKEEMQKELVTQILRRLSKIK